MSNTNFIQNLDNELNIILEEVKNSDYWNKFTSPELPNSFKLDAMKWVMREISTYQLEVNRAVFTAVGRLGTQIEHQGLIRAMIAVQIEEVGHGTVALNDFFKLGGTESEAKDLPSPSSLSVISVVRFLGEHHNPLCHLGYMYFFEKFTVMITEVVTPFLEQAKYPNDSLEFMKLHAQEDERHSNMLAEVIQDAIEQFEDAEKHIKYGFDCFKEIYPHSLWRSSINKVKLVEGKI